MPAYAPLTCRDCGQAFTFTSGEQDFYAARGYSEPGRCPDCRAARKAERGGGGGGGYSSYGSGGGYGGGGSRGGRGVVSATRPGGGEEAQGACQASGAKTGY